MWAFEPTPQTFQLLKRNVKENHLKNINLYEAGLSDKSGRGQIFINDYNKGDNRIYESFGAKGVDIQLTTLDAIINPLIPISFIKMDIQGAEVLALRGMCRVLRENSDLILISEVWPRKMERAGTSVEEFFSILKQNGFSWVVIDEERGRVVFMTEREFYTQFPSTDPDAATNLLCWKGRCIVKEIL